MEEGMHNNYNKCSVKMMFGWTKMSQKQKIILSLKPNGIKNYKSTDKEIHLSSLQANTLDFMSILKKRCSTRVFNKRYAITFDQLSMLIYSVAGITDTKEKIHESQRFIRRVVPSACACYPIEVYVFSNRITNLKSGLYHYSVYKRTLNFLKPLDVNVLTKGSLKQPFIKRAACTFIFTSVFGRTEWKCGDRAFRYMCLDAGHIGQNLYLMATLLGLGCVTIGSFYDDEINQILELNDDEEWVLYMGSVGHIKK